MTTNPNPKVPSSRSRTVKAPERAPVPLGVWPVAQVTAQYQRAGRYLPACTRHPGKMLPALARRIVCEYSSPGDLVVDPMCGIGTTLAEAALCGRRSVGVELDPRWAALCEKNLAFMLTGPQRRLARVREGDARKLPDVCSDLAGTVGLVVVSPPYACDAGVIDRKAWLEGGRLCDSATLNYSTDPDNLGHARGARYEAALTRVYAGCATLLRPGGRLVVVTKNTRRKGATNDLAGLTVALVIGAGLSYLGHVIALHAAVRDGDLVARPSYWQLTQVRHARAKGEPAHLVTHEDVTVFALLGQQQQKEDARAR